MKKHLMLVLLAPLALASCNLFNTPKPVTGVSGTVVEGTQTINSTTGDVTLTTKAWSGGAGKVVVDVADGNTNKLLTETALSAQGAFVLGTLPVPPLKKLSSVTPTGCTDSVVVSDKDVQGNAASFRVDAANDRAIELMSVSGKTTNLAILTYVDRNVTQKGKVECKDTAGKVTSTADVDVRLVKGWNWTYVSLTPSTSTAAASATMRNGTPAGAQWVFMTAATTASLKAHSLF
ncbi:hypothetical protein K7W42_14520 [Deinococcus sp. HMF7604]|uniref:hypothetical protein n=1 Tax=Deinococcus betulae TaxID=2873312 RepID=UPI001CCCA1F6|nr:hypothetical protein [Deinococcus betulae]MBZ9752072.1 hypothetical protein [Deinococcus betulae]